jgi:aldose 1-epimerase
MNPHITLTLIAALLVSSPAAAQYSARRNGTRVELEDAAHQTVVSIDPAAGNLTREMSIKGHHILAPRGIPFMAPWANRLDEQAFYANGRKYHFNMELGNVRGARPIHGFLSEASQWEVVEARSDNASAWVTSRLEFFRQPAWMAQFPFAHTIEMTHRLQNGALEIAASLHNLSADPMPVAIGFHPYFTLSDAPRDDWNISIGARTEWMLSPDKIPTGELLPIERRFPDPRAARLGEHDLDHVFGDLTRDAAGGAVMSVAGQRQRLDVVYGPNYRASVVYAPRGREFICFEPMAGITNALNLAQRGVYKELQYVAPGQTWRESFWIRPSGF